MRKTLIPFMVIAVILSLSSFRLDNDQLKPGFYYLAENENTGVLVKDTDGKNYAIEKESIIDTRDFLKAKITTIDFKPNTLKAMQLTLSDQGRRKWETAKKRAAKTGESLLFVCGNTIYLEKRFMGADNSKHKTIDLMVDPEYLEWILGEIKNEIATVAGRH